MQAVTFEIADGILNAKDVSTRWISVDWESKEEGARATFQQQATTSFGEQEDSGKDADLQFELTMQMAQGQMEGQYSQESTI